MQKNTTDTEKRTASASAEGAELEELADKMHEGTLEGAIRQGIKTPHIKVMSRLLLGSLLIISISAFGAALVRYGELQREKTVLEEKVVEYEAEVERLEYMIDCPVDYDYIVRIAKEKLNLYLPDEIIYHNDSNKK